MTDKAAPKPRKARAKNGEKKPAGPKVVASTIKPGMGHNRGQIVPEVKKIVEEILASATRQKAEGKIQRELRNKAKTEFGVLSGALSHEIRLRKMDPDVRVQFESSHQDLKQMLGYQPQLDFVGATPTQASVKAQPSEAEAQRFSVDDGGEAQTKADDRATARAADAEPKAAGEAMPEQPAFLRRSQSAAPQAAPNPGVITRQG